MTPLKRVDLGEDKGDPVHRGDLLARREDRELEHADAVDQLVERMHDHAGGVLPLTRLQTIAERTA